LPIFGPTAEAARLESSKIFAKTVMGTAGVPTAPACLWSSNQVAALLGDYATRDYPIVLKANGLAKGKGVTVCQTPVDAIGALVRCWQARDFGDGGEAVLLEDFLEGHPSLPRAEFSVLALVDIHGNIVPFVPAQDYKPVNDGDDSPNTGGMGAFGPIPWITKAMMEQVVETILKPMIAEMKKRGIPFSGVLYAGLIWTAEGPKVVEFNVRFGDPELQPLLMLLETDLIPILKLIARGESIAGIELKWKSGAAVCLVLASEGYPGKYAKGRDIYFPDEMPQGPDFKVFHAGTKKGNIVPLTDGGRVLNLVQRTDTLEKAASTVLTLAQKFSFGKQGEAGYGVHHRTDIGFGVPPAIG